MLRVTFFSEEAPDAEPDADELLDEPPQAAIERAMPETSKSETAFLTNLFIINPPEMFCLRTTLYNTIFKYYIFPLNSNAFLRAAAPYEGLENTFFP